MPRNNWIFSPELRDKVSEESQLDHLKNLIRQRCAMQRKMSERDKYDWKVDFQFYVDRANMKTFQNVQDNVILRFNGTSE